MDSECSNESLPEDHAQRYLDFNGVFDEREKLINLPWGTFDAKSSYTFKTGERNPWCKCVTEVRAPVRQVLETVWDLESGALKYDKDIHFEILERESSHSLLFKCTLVYNLVPGKVRDMAAISRASWKRRAAPSQLNNNLEAYEMVFSPVSQDCMPGSHSSGIRLDFSAVFQIEAVNSRKTFLSYIFQFKISLDSHYGNLVLHSFQNLNMMILKSHRRIVTTLKLYFLTKRDITMIDAQDGRDFGNILFAKGCGKKTRAVHLITSINKFRALKQLSEEYPWLAHACATLLRNTFRKPASNTVVIFTDVEDIFGGLATLLTTNLSSKGAVQEWRMQHPPVVEEFLETQPWTLSMIEQIGQRLMETVGFGLILRVSVSAFFVIS